MMVQRKVTLNSLMFSLRVRFPLPVDSYGFVNTRVSEEFLSPRFRLSLFYVLFVCHNYL